MKNALFKDTLREVWHTKSRFISIALIVALGTGFFCGIKMTCPNMKDSADEYYQEQKLSDFHIMGNYGLSENDITALRRLDGVAAVMPGYSADVFIGDEGDQNIVRVYSFPTHMDIKDSNFLNRPLLLEGRYPQNANECVVEKSLTTPSSFYVGNTITFENGNKDAELEDYLNVNFCNIVGVVKSPMYVNFERGSSQIGNGQVSSYIMLAEDNFTYDVYTDVYVSLEDSFKYSSFSDEYENLIDDFTTVLEEFGETRSEIRYKEIMDEANEKITDAEKELADAKDKLVDAEDELSDGKKTQASEVAKAKKKLENARQDLIDGQKEYDKEYADYLKEIEDAKKEIADAYKEIEDNEKKISDGWQDYYEGLAKYQSSKSEARYELQQAQSQVNGLKEFANSTSQLAQGIGAGLVDKSYAMGVYSQLEAMKPGSGSLLKQAIDYGTDQDVATALTGVSASLNDQAKSAQNQIDRGYDKLDSAEESLEDAKKKLQDGEKEIADAKQELADAEIELQENIEKAEKEFADAREELADGEEKIKDAQITLNKEIAKSNKEIKDGEEKIADAWVEINDAELELTDAKADVADLSAAEWFVFDRTGQPGYGDYGVDAERVDKIAGIFPFFFILVAGLICLTTMTRMVEEQRTQIGTLKALGYSDTSIMKKYLLYAVGASLIGSAIGLTIGFPLFPKIIFEAYSMMYDYPPIHAPFHLWVGLGATIVAIICTTVAAYFAGIKELQSQPSQLMRPKVPKSGKKILLERWHSLWNKVSFSYKVTIRNISRYKSRVALTVIGIAGCTALMLTGFGLQHSISSIATRQFNDIFQYDLLGAIDTDLSAEELLEVEKVVSQTEELSDYTFVYTKNMDLEFGKNSYNTTLFVVDQPEIIDKFITFQVRTTKEPLTLNDEGVIINEKLAKLLGLQVGDTFKMEENNIEADLLVTGICENYAMNYVYMTPAYYEKMYNKNIEINAFIANMKEFNEVNQSAAATKLLENDHILGISYVSEIGDKFMNLMDSLNIIVVVLILCAGLLAFIVLYNLTNINVNERLRELATIKVLGFYDGEVSAYIYRENTISAVMGIFVGLWLGIYLHAFVIKTAEVDVVMFDPTVGTLSFVFAGLLTLLFTFVVNFALHFRLKKIDMVESLKSVE